MKKFAIFLLLAFYAGSFFNSGPVILPVDIQEQIEKNRRCLVEALWHEARSENEQGIRAVANVIVNRKQSKIFPATVCKVVYQNRQFSYTHQLKNHQAKPKAVELEKYRTIVKISYEITQGLFKPVVKPEVLWYHTVSVSPSWNKSMKLAGQFGQHKFWYK